MDPVLYGPGEGEHHDAGPAQIFIKATGEHTGGSFFLAESTLAPGFAGPPPHRHRELHDMFYVLEGTLTLRLGDREIEAGPGSRVVFRLAAPSGRMQGQERRVLLRRRAAAVRSRLPDADALCETPGLSGAGTSLRRHRACARPRR